MTQYYCHVCDQHVNAIDTIKTTLAHSESKEEPTHSSHHHTHQLECEHCHQSYIEEVEAAQPAPAVATAATITDPTPATAPSQPATSATPPFIAQPSVQPFAQLQPRSQLLAPMFVSGPNVNIFPSAPFVPMMQPLPFPFPFPFANFIPQPHHHATAAQQSQLASHPGNYAPNGHHFNNLLSSFLHPLHQPHASRGLDATLLAALPRRRVGAVGGVGVGGVGGACVVCQCELECDDEVITLPACSHIFHSHCLEPWLKEHDLCPTCRKQVTQAEGLAQQADSEGSNSATSDSAEVGSGTASRASESVNESAVVADAPR